MGDSALASVVHFSSFAPITSMLLQVQPANGQQSTNLKAQAVKNFDQLRAVLNSRARLLILDLEFFQDTHQRNRVAQIAGRMYQTHMTFNYKLYATSMPPERQLAFLKQSNLRYSEVEEYQIASVLQRFNQFIASQQPDYIVSWDNSTDFNLLNQAANKLKIPQKQRPWCNIQSLDLEKLIAKEVWKNKSAISLEKMFRLLHLPRVKFHQAQNDVWAIEQVLKFYSLDLDRELNW